MLYILYLAFIYCQFEHVSGNDSMAVCTCTTEVCMQSQTLTQKAAGSAEIREGL